MAKLIKRHVYLSRFMGAGKSKAGRLLAGQLYCPFYDTDKWIEAKAGKKVKMIFEEDGETAFRDLESRSIKKLAKKRKPAIIALGGGALQRDENLAKIKESGLLIYIKSSPEQILQRVKNSKKRPLLSVEEGENSEALLLDKISKLLQSRENRYRQADLIVERDAMEIEELVEKLKEKITNYWKDNENHTS
ncbi:MAG: shikimate kinase [Calditrichaceae bacterium]|nr:shikimate kinase [Calditrichaceae bacterium]RQV96172.1 MAG: shikimate kinase [Calditrichota bacterium]